VRLGVFLVSHHILFRFTILSPSCCSLNPSFHPFSFPKLTIHHFPVSVLCCSAGIITLLLLPSLAKNTYLSENALIPGILPFSLFLFTATLLMHTRCCFWRVCLSGGRTPRSLQTAYCRYFIIKCIVLFSACFVEYKSSDEATYQYC